MITEKIVKRFNRRLRKKLIDKANEQIRTAEMREETLVNELKEEELKRSGIEY